MKSKALVSFVAVFVGALVLVGSGSAKGTHIPSLSGHICKQIGGVWTRSTLTCEISGTGTVSGSLKLTDSEALQVDEGATLNVTASGFILDVAGTEFGIWNYGTVNNAGTISNNGTFDGGVINFSTGTFNNTGDIAMGYQNLGFVGNQGTFDNSGYLQAWEISSSGSLTNESSADLYANDNLYVGTGGTVDNSGYLFVQYRIWDDSGGTITNQSGATLISRNGSLTSFQIDGTLDNYGNVQNWGPLVNEADGTITNRSGASIDNYDSIDNYGAVTNGGTITDWCTATFTNEDASSYSGNSVVADC